MGKESRFPFLKTQTWYSVPPIKEDGVTPAARPSMNSWPIAYWHEKKLPVVVTRLFNTVGPRQIGRYGMVLPTFVKQALLGEEMTVFGDGSQARCFAHVSDVVEALYRLSEKEAAVGQVFNIGSKEECTILNLAKKVKFMTASQSKIVFVPYDKAYEEGFEDMPRRVPDISRLQSLIEYGPAKNLEQIIQSVIDYQRALLEVTTDTAT